MSEVERPTVLSARVGNWTWFWSVHSGNLGGDVDVDVGIGVGVVGGDSVLEKKDGNLASAGEGFESVVVRVARVPAPMMAERRSMILLLSDEEAISREVNFNFVVPMEEGENADAYSMVVDTLMHASVITALCG